jgi:acetoin utilization protein AcuB
MKYLHELLSKHTKLFTVTPKQTLDDVYEIMTTNRIHHIPVVAEDSISTEDSAGELVGIITDRDIRLAINSPLMFHKREEMVHDNQRQREYKREFEAAFDSILLDLEKHTVSEIMQKNVITASPDITIVDAAKKIKECNVGAVPVVRKGTNQLVGIYTRTDLADHLIRILEPLEKTPKKELTSENL